MYGMSVNIIGDPNAAASGDAISQEMLLKDHVIRISRPGYASEEITIHTTVAPLKADLARTEAQLKEYINADGSIKDSAYAEGFMITGQKIGEEALKGSYVSHPERLLATKLDELSPSQTLTVTYDVSSADFNND